MPKTAALHLMNDFFDSSISRIVQQLIQHEGPVEIDWHVGAFQDNNLLLDDFIRMGVQTIDFSQNQKGFHNQVSLLRSYIFENKIELVHAHTPRTILLTALAIGRRSHPIHLATKHLLYRTDDRRWGEVYYVLDRFSLYLPDHLVAVSNEMKKSILRFPLIKDDRVTVVRNAIEFENYYCPEYRNEIRDQLGIKSDSIAIGFAGRIAPAKNLDILFKAFSRVYVEKPNLHLIVIGRGEHKPELERLASDLNISQSVIWTGFRKDIPRLLAGLDIYIQPSGNEGLSLSLLEAMAAEKAVIATDVGGTSEVVIDHVTGLLIPAQSVNALKLAIIRLLDDPKFRADLANAGRKRVSSEFGNQRMIDNYWQVYKRLLVTA